MRNLRLITLAAAGAFLPVIGLVVAASWNRAGRLPEVPVPPGATSRLPEGERYETRVDLVAQAMDMALEGEFGPAEPTIYLMPDATVPAEVVAFVGRSLGGDWAPVANRCRLRGHPVDAPDRRVITSCRWTEQSPWWPRAVEVAVFHRLDRVPPAYWPDAATVVIARSRGR